MTEPTPVTGTGGADAYARLAELGLTLPQVLPPLASYVPAVQSGNYVYVSGQLPFVDGALPYTGKVGADVTPEQGAELARFSALNALAAIDALVGLGRIVKIVKITGFVASAEGFGDQATERLSCSVPCWVSWAGTPAARSAWPSCRWALRWRSR